MVAKTLFILFLLHMCGQHYRLLPVLGHRAFTAIPSALSSSAIPRTHNDIPYFAILYAANTSTHTLVFMADKTQI